MYRLQHLRFGVAMLAVVEYRWHMAVTSVQHFSCWIPGAESRQLVNGYLILMVQIDGCRVMPTVCLDMFGSRSRQDIEPPCVKGLHLSAQPLPLRR